MSDYLSHLIARTLSFEAMVRPLLRSAFEPAPLNGGFTGRADPKLETLAESNPPASLAMSASAPLERFPSREPRNAAPSISPTRDEQPRQAVPPAISTSIHGETPPLESKEDLGIAAVQPLLPPLPIDHEPSMKLKVLEPVVSSSPDSIRENSPAVSTPPPTPRSDPVPAPRQLRAAPISNTVHPSAAVVRHQTVESEQPRLDRIALVAVRSVAPAPTVLSQSRSVAPISDATRPAAGAIRSQTAESEERRLERFAVAAIRPGTPAAPVFSPHLPPAVAPPPRAIHVTIGRVEVRAMSPPPTRGRTQAATPPVMSLEEYLGKRAARGQR